MTKYTKKDVERAYEIGAKEKLRQISEILTDGFADIRRRLKKLGFEK